MSRHGPNSLHLRRGRLLERIATQRRALGEAILPVQSALATTDRVVANVRTGISYVKAHPGLLVIAAAILFTLKAGRTLRWAKRGFLAWRTFKALREKLPFSRTVRG